MSGSEPEVISITSSSILHTLPGRYYLSWIDEHGVPQRQKAILCEHGANDTMHVRTADEHWSIRSDSQWIPLYTLVGKASLERLVLRSERPPFLPLTVGAQVTVPIVPDFRASVPKLRTNMTESLVWFDATDTQPDDGQVVLVLVPEANEFIWPGYLEGNEWHYADGSTIENDVRAWTEMPVGPLKFHMPLAARHSELAKSEFGTEVQHG